MQKSGFLRWCAMAVATLASVPGAPAQETAAVKSLIEFREERVVVQKWDLSCGAAALATLLNYQHGDPVSEKEIAAGLMQRREYIENPLLVQSREGFSLLDLQRYVKQRGYTGTGLGGMSLEDLPSRAPIIVPIRVHGYNHFVVFRGIHRNRVLLADPAWGNRTMHVSQFERAWITFPGIGRVGFTVKARDRRKSPNLLAPRPGDFLILDD